MIQLWRFIGGGTASRKADSNITQVRGGCSPSTLFSNNYLHTFKMPFALNVKTLIPKLGLPLRQRQDGTSTVPAWQLKFQHLQPLKSVVLPQVSPDHQQNLAENGWAPVGYRSAEDPLQTSFQELLRASQAFFELPEEYKQGFATQRGTEEGWKRVEGEKEFITLRSIEKTPDILKDAASKYWVAAGSLLNEQLGRIAESLGLPAESLTAYSEPCSQLGTESTATMLRLFRYEGYDGSVSKTVAEGMFDSQCA